MKKVPPQIDRGAGAWRGRNSFPQRSQLTKLFAVIVYSVTGAAFAFPQTLLPVTFAVSVGSGIGALIGFKTAQSRYRLGAIVAAILCVVLALVGLHRVLVETVWLASALGPSVAVKLSDTFFYGTAALVCAIGLKTATLRFRFLSVFEVALISLAFAELLVAHRNGAINRPFEIADPIISMGDDPTIAFLLFGVATALLIDIMLLHEQNLVRTVLHLSVIAVILLSTLYATTAIGLPQPPGSLDQLGLRKEDGQHKRDNKKRRRGRGAERRRSDQDLTFRDDYRTSTNRVPLAVVLLHDDYSPPTGVYYFRQNAFSQYNGNRLVSASGTDLDRDIVERFPVKPIRMPEVPNQSGERATLDTTVALLADHKRPFALESPVALMPVSNPDPGRFRRLYRVTSVSISVDLYSLFGRKAGSPNWSAEQRNHYTDGPSDTRYHQLATEIIKEVRPELRLDPMAHALAISAWLSREGIYSLRSRHTRTPDPTADFLFGDKTGYCVHFAHAAVFLMRSLGIPTRIATGYVVEESSRRGGSTIVLNGENSHAWPEVFLEGIGWVVIDVIPERSIDPPPQPPDPDLQRLLGEMVRGQRPLPYATGRPFEPMVEYVGHLTQLLVRIVLYLVLSIVVVLYTIKALRRVVPRLSSSKSLPRTAYRAELDRLSELFVRRRFGESRERFARRVAEITPSFTELTRLHLQSAFGVDRGIAKPELRKLSKKIGKELRTSVPRWRRIAGLLTPWSWVFSR